MTWLTWLIIADDFTGALDTGVCSCSRCGHQRDNGPPALILRAWMRGFALVGCETRHLAPERAYALSGGQAQPALDAGIRCILQR